MPIYAYKCGSCGHAKDVLQKISDAPQTQCPACGKEAWSKQLSAPGFQLKGTGWYATDFKNGGTTAPAVVPDSEKGKSGADGAGAASSESNAAGAAQGTSSNTTPTEAGGSSGSAGSASSPATSSASATTTTSVASSSTSSSSGCGASCACH